jgi:hypothetical protein
MNVPQRAFLVDLRVTKSRWQIHGGNSEELARAVKEVIKGQEDHVLLKRRA